MWELEAHKKTFLVSKWIDVFEFKMLTVKPFLVNEMWPSN